MSVRIGVVTFPGTLDDGDALRAIRLAGGEPVVLWHAHDDLKNVDAVVLPGGFSYGDYLRCGAIASFAPVMTEVIARAKRGMPVLGICNGFQVLCETHLLPGVLTRNDDMKFICRQQRLSVETNDTVWTCAMKQDSEVTFVIKHGEGNFRTDAETLQRIEDNNQVVFRYVGGNPNGSLNDIAGITNEAGNVVGLMPHPEHNVEQLSDDSVDGLEIFRSAIAFVESRGV